MTDATERDLDVLAAGLSHDTASEERIAALLQESKDELHGDAARQLAELCMPLVIDVLREKGGSLVAVSDLFQEGAVGVVVAIEEYAIRQGLAKDLKPYVRKVVSLHIDAAIEREAEEVETEKQLVIDAEKLETAEVVLRRELGRDPTDIETAARLEWTAERVKFVHDALVEARGTFDLEILEVLAELESDEEE